MIHPGHLAPAPNGDVSRSYAAAGREYLRRAALCERWGERGAADRLRACASKAWRRASFYTHGKGIPT